MNTPSQPSSSPNAESKSSQDTSAISSDTKHAEEQKQPPLKRSLSTISDREVDAKKAKIEPLRELLVAVDL